MTARTRCPGTTASQTLRVLPRLAVPLAAALVMTACGSDPENAPNPDTRTADPESSATAPPSESESAEEFSPGAPVEARDLATSLDTPWGMAALDDGSLVVGSRDTGEIRLLAPGAEEGEVIGTVDGVRAEGESGLLDLAVTEEQDRLLAYYTTESDSRVVALDLDVRRGRLGAPQVLVEGIPGGADYHQGGGLALGPDDGLLYVSTGDNGEPDSAQDRESLSGKVLRYTLDGEPAPDNPFGTAIYSWGHRNVEGLAFDDEGRLWASEFGQNTWDELNLIEAGANYGWPEVEGTGGGEEFVDPQAVWRTENASPAGLAFWDGSLWMAALRGETLWEIPLADGGTGDAEAPVAHLAGEHGRLRNAVVLDDALVVATSNTDGRGQPAADDDRLLQVRRAR